MAIRDGTRGVVQTAQYKPAYPVLLGQSLTRPAPGKSSSQEPMKVSIACPSSRAKGLDFSASLKFLKEPKSSLTIRTEEHPEKNEEHLPKPSPKSSPKVIVNLSSALEVAVSPPTPPPTPPTAASWERPTGSAAELAVDAVGHAIVENMLQKGSREQRLSIASELTGHVLQLSTDGNGCRVVQKAIQVLPCQAQLNLFQELSVGIQECILSKHGNFVVQLCIEQLPPGAVTPIINAILTNVRTMACHKYACRTIQRLTEHCPAERIESMLDQAVEAAVDIAKNQYGCHVLRCILEHGRVEDKLRIFRAMQEDVARLARNRLASLVIEKCLDVAVDGEHKLLMQRERLAFTQIVFYNDHASELPLLEMVTTRFGRSILRRLIDSASASEKEELKRKVSDVCPGFMLRTVGSADS